MPRRRKEITGKASESEPFSVAGGSSPPPQPPPPRPKRSKPKKSRKRKTLGKGEGVFLCTNENCRNSWASAHAWSPYRFDCQQCGGTAKVLEEVEKECELDRYECSVCGIDWQSIHNEDEETMWEVCDCGNRVDREARTQLRYGTHYYYQCKGECAQEWEYFYDGKPYTQRCRKCRHRGMLMGVRKVELGPDGKPIQRNKGGRGLGLRTGGGHEVDGCDMCHALFSQGIAKSCIRKRMVAIEQGWDQITGEGFDRIVDCR